MKTVDLRIHERLVYNGFRNTSFNPEGRTAQTLNDYTQELANDLETLPESERERYAIAYEKMFVKWQSSRTNLASSFVTGPANFPVERMRKYNEREQKHYENFRKFRENVKQAIARRERRKNRENIDPIAELEQKLEKLKLNHEKMKEANLIIRDKKITDVERFDKIKALGMFDSAKIVELIQGDYMKRKGFPTYSLQYSNANIKRVEDRIALLKRRANGNTAEKTMHGVRIVANVPENRMQLFFPDKPSDVVRNTLKRNGFRWTPSKGCWQSYLSYGVKEKTERVLQEYAKGNQQ